MHNTKLVILLSVLALGSVLADVYYLAHGGKRQMMRFEGKQFNVRTVRVASKDFEVVSSQDDTDTETDVGTDLDTDTEVSQTPTPTPTPTRTPTPTSTPPIKQCPTCDTNAQCNTTTGKCVCLATFEGNGQVCKQQKTLTGSLRLDGSLQSFDDNCLKELSISLGNKCNVPASNVKLSASAAKAVLLAFTIFVPESLAASGVDLNSVAASMSDVAGLVAAFNTVFASLGIPTISSLDVAIAASPSPTPSISPSRSLSPSPTQTLPAVVQNEEHKSKSSGLSNGAIAGVVIGSVAGAILIVAIIGFAQMKFHKKTKKAHTSSMAGMIPIRASGASAASEGTRERLINNQNKAVDAQMDRSL